MSPVTITTYRPCQVGETLEIRGVPVQKFEKKGHEFVVLDVLIRLPGTRPCSVSGTRVSFVHARANARRVDNGGQAGKGQGDEAECAISTAPDVGSDVYHGRRVGTPQHFGDPHAEYQALRHGVGLCDLSHRSLVRVTGRSGNVFTCHGLE